MWRVIGKQLQQPYKVPGVTRGFPIYTRQYTSKTGYPAKPSRNLEKYDNSVVESGWYEWWESQGFFSARSAPAALSNSDITSRESNSVSQFTMIIPPPNVTGYLHIGHALTASVQDSIVRWRRMRGESVSWVPGMDHAGISTQTVVEKQLMKETKQTRHDLGREAFVEKIWDWKKLYGDNIVQQFKRLGASMDWNENFFTLDETRTEAVRSAFVQLFRDGLVYRDTRLVNWCCALETVISDIEVDYEDIEGMTKLSVPGRLRKVEFGVLHDFAYKIDGDDAQELVVSTTRIETMLGDEAVAIHPDDPRYKHLHRKYVVHPISQKRLPIICDPELVDMEFGTGVVKVTPAHDPNDYACGRRHGLPIVNILQKDGSFNANCGSKAYENMNRFDAREKIVEDLMSLGLYRGKNEKHAMRLAKCSRSGDVIEPMVMPQWYIKCDTMAQRALEDAKAQNLVFNPESAVKDWERWLENIQDWCISRQLWWGHRIPAYRPVFEDKSSLRAIVGADVSDGPWFVAESEEDASKQIYQFISDKNLGHLKYKVVQDEDVLDTWFSSGLLPLSALGWTGKTLPSGSKIPERYPTAMIETGTDIMFFWVARMVMLCTHLSGQVPFKDIMFHALVRDAQGRKMSKSVGNVIDPTHVIEGITLKELKDGLLKGNLSSKEVKRSQAQMEKDFPKGIQASGADALRFALVSSTQQTRQINLDLNNVASAQHFANKLWNLSTFYKSHLKDMAHETTVTPEMLVAPGLAKILNESNRRHFSLVERFIMSRLANTVKVVNAGMEQLQPSIATDTVRQFVIQDLCDVYLEFIKPTMFSANDEATQSKPRMHMVLQTCLDASLRMLHPFMPFVTEELWQRMLSDTAHSNTSIMTSAFPSSDELELWKDESAEQDMGIALDIIKAARSLRQSHQVPMSKELPFTIWTSDRSLLTESGALQQSHAYLAHFTRALGGEINFIDASTGENGKQDISSTESSFVTHIVSPQVKLITPLAAIQNAKTSAMTLNVSGSETSGQLSTADRNKQEQELKRLEKKLKAVQTDLEKVESRMAKAEYINRVPEGVRATDLKRKQDLLAQENHFRETIKTLRIALE